jgi:hypothetical protein
MNGRLYDPVLGRFLSPDNYVQAPDFTQNFNRYSYVLNNPLKYTDPSGELFWIPMAVGATIGGIKGMITAHNLGYDLKDWQFYAYSVAGSLIGAGVAYGSYGLSLAGASPAVIGAAAGASSGASYTALAGGSGEEIAWSSFVGGTSGFVGGAVSSATATGYGSGPFLGGISSNLTAQLLNNKGDFDNIDWESTFISGMISVGLYYTESIISYQIYKPNVYNKELSLDQYLRVNAADQRSRFWKKEYGVYLNNNGTARFVSAKYRHKFSVDFKEFRSGDFGTVHTHWAKSNVDWVDIGGRGRQYRRYHSRKTYPSGSTIVTTVGGYHSSGDMKTLPSLSIVVGRTTSTYYMQYATTYNYIIPDPFIRFFIYNW